MLHRDDPNGFTVITQPAHAWVSGQLARAWGSRRFGTFYPYEEMCLAAEQHDIGWLEWERAPTLNLKTGRPHSFMDLPVPDHTTMWSSSGELAKIQGRYSALLISMHGSGLYERHDGSKDSPQDARLIQEYLKDAHAFEAALLADLKRDNIYGSHYLSPEIIARNRRLIGVWDYLSLMVCMGLKEGQSRTIERVPCAKGVAALTLKSLGNEMVDYAISPWPFKTKLCQLQVDGRKLPRTFNDQEAMRAALKSAEWVTMTIVLQPGK
jgi:hypothetical protein